jgi:DNA mismatch repair protein MutS
LQSREQLDELQDIHEILESAIMDNPGLSVKDGNVIKSGYSADVDELRSAKANGKEWISALENSEREATGIKSLKVGFNKVFGYYIEITKSNFSQIPEGRYIRKQTLANAERYITPELKEMEDKILGAEEKLLNLEYKLFTQIRENIEQHIYRMKHTARILSDIDCICSLTATALENKYVKPEFNNDGIIDIKDGRHPVVEKVINTGSYFVGGIGIQHIYSIQNTFLLN